MIYGYINAHNPVVKDITIDVNKPKGTSTTINAVMISDIHLGLFSKGEWFDDIINKINALEPDVVLLVGDVIDEDIKPVISHNLGEHLENIKSKYGVYAVTGNHEYIGGVEPAVKYIQEHNVIMLRDTSILINNDFYISGREDRDKVRATGKQRKTIDEMLNGLDNQYPVIMMNHQPFELKEMEGKKVDLLLCGHTHHGQIWPLNIITNKIYEISRGYVERYGTRIYVSNGIGTWGPPMRIGNTPEIIHFKINVNHN
jgi:predicted MPP superfamily phosphohydrolase